MKKFAIQIVILTATIFGVLYLAYHQDLILPYLPFNPPSPLQQLKVGEVVVNIEIADTVAKRTKGLSGRESLATDSGMLFVFQTPKKYQFWMKGMKFALDLIFIRDGKIVDLLKNVAPPTPNQSNSQLPIYEPVVPIDMMLEVSSGFIDQHNIRAGDVILLVKNQ